MLTGKFPAGTTALDSCAGEIDAYLIERAPLAFSPQRLRTLTEVLPVSRAGKLFAGTCRTAIGGQGHNLIGGELYAQICASQINVFLCGLKENSFAV